MFLKNNYGAIDAANNDKIGSDWKTFKELKYITKRKRADRKMKRIEKIKSTTTSLSDICDNEFFEGISTEDKSPVVPTRQNPTICNSIIKNLTKGKLKKINIKRLVSHLVAEYRNVDFIINISNNLLNFIGDFKKDDTKYQNTLLKCRNLIPTAVFSMELFNKVKKYYDNLAYIADGKTTNDTFSESLKKYLEFIDMEDQLYSDEFTIGFEIAKWLFTSPKTENFKILKCKNFITENDVSKIDDDLHDKIIVIEFNGDKFCLYFNLEAAKNNSVTLSDTTKIYYNGSNNIHISQYALVQSMVSHITKEFLQSLDTENNSILLSPYDGIKTDKRLKPVEKSVQIDIDAISNEIRNVLSKGKKRGYIFVGVPGTGKSTMIHIIESIITDYPIVYITTECFSDSQYINDAFKIISYIQPCIVVMEDMDSYNLSKKNRELGELLERIDDVDNKLNIILLATVNDTSGVHYSLINRPGRFDEIVVVDTPKSKQEIYSVMKCRYNKNKEIESGIDPTVSEKELLPMNKISGKVYRSIIKNKYSHADVCEIIEKSLFVSYDITNKTLISSIENLKKSKRAIKDFNFKGDDPNKLLKA